MRETVTEPLLLSKNLMCGRHGHSCISQGRSWRGMWNDPPKITHLTGGGATLWVHVWPQTPHPLLSVLWVLAGESVWGRHKYQWRETFTLAGRRGTSFSNPGRKEKEKVKVGKNLRWRRKFKSASGKALTCSSEPCPQNTRTEDFSALKK